LIIPIDSVLRDNDGYYVYIIVDDQAVKTYVEIGEDDGEIVEINAGLSKEDQLVVRGQNYITESTKIRVVTGGN
jgi:multidrug efflux pump subunit AcrA (membrane-fusion protein)